MKKKLERKDGLQRSRWLWLLALLLMLPLQSLRARSLPAFSDKLVNGTNGNKVATPDNPWITFSMCYFDFEGDNSNWQSNSTVSVYVDGVYQGTLNQMGVYIGSDERYAYWNGRGYTYPDCRIEFGDFAESGYQYWVNVNILYFNNPYGQEHTFELRGNYLIEWDWYSFDGVNRTLKYTSNPTNYVPDAGSLTKIESKQTRWTSPTFNLTKNDGFNVKADLRANNQTIASVQNTGDTQKTLTKDFNLVNSNYTIDAVSVNYTCSRTVPSKLVSNTYFTANFPSSTGTIYSNGYPKAQITECVTDMWAKRVSLKWTPQFSNNDHKDTGGKWYLERTDNVTNTTETLGTVDYSTTQYIDANDVLAYSDSEDNRYTYTVTFMPNNWALSSCSDLQATTKTAIVRKFDFSDLALDCGVDKLTFTWHNPAINGSGNDYKFKVFRKENNGEWEEVTEIPVNDKTKTEYTYVDNKLPSSCDTYYYKAAINIFDKLMESAEVSGTITGSSRVDNLEATKGEYSGSVKLNWTATQVSTTPTFYQVFRRVYGSETGWVSIYTVEDTKENYFYEDNTAHPGTYYEYRVGSSYKCNGVMTEPVYVTDDGFCRTTGVVSGKVTYGSGMAVPNVRVMLKKDGDNQGSQFYSLRMPGKDGGVRLAMTDEEYEQFMNSPFTIQFYVNPDEKQESGSIPVIFDLGENFQLALEKDGSLYQLTMREYGDQWACLVSTDLYIPAGRFSSITLTKTANEGLTLYVADQYGELTSQNFKDVTVTSGNPVLALGGAYSTNGNRGFTGYMDEMRVFSGVALSQEEIAKNYNHTLSGNEDGLFAYWPADEGFKGQTKAYDYSKTAGVANGHHGKFGSGTYSVSDVIPDNTQLGLLGNTDENGNYVVHGVPFSGEGTNYTISPSLGVHKFSPIHATRYVSASSLVHSAVDFEDVSSFKMNGYVYYENTNIPVEGAYLYVDGTICAKDGEPILTSETGAFEISVPIGDHYVQVKKDGHTFVNGGRFPADPKETGTVYTFIKDETVTFYDDTKVMIAGRVVGGKNENEKPLGLGQSKANIGQAKIVLSTRQNSRYLNYIYDEATGTSSLGTNDMTFKAKYGTATVPGTNTQSGAQHLMTIMTDATTGEFAVEVPPLDYAVTSISIPSHSGYTFTSLPSINATDVLSVKTDSAEVDSVTHKFEYIASMKMAYTNNATMTITDMAHEDGAIGESVIKGKDANDVEHSVNAYTVNAQTGAVTYAQGAPLLIQNKKYQYKISAYQEYVNYDGEQPVVDQMPMSKSVIRIANDYAMGAPIVIQGDADKVGKSARELQEAGQLPADVQLDDDELMLDDNGEVVYQFTAGYPKTVSPYTRGCTIAMNDDASAQWTSNAIILGTLPKGNDFVTGGPDKVTMILRDPAGSHSKTTYSKGSTVKKTTKNSFSAGLGESIGVEACAGGTQKFVAGSLVFAKETSIEIEAKMTGGMEVTETFNYDGTSETTTTTGEEYSTSSDWDWTGAQADVFIGTGTNYIIGAATRLGYTFATNGAATFGTDDAVTVGQGFTTNFSYTQNYIEQVLIPNLEDLRNSFINPVGSVLTAGDQPKYVSTVSADDENFGQDGYYTIVAPTDTKKSYADTVSYYNMQISAWKQHLANNEEAKVTVIKNRDKWLKLNRSFDSGTTFTSTVTNEQSMATSYSSTTELKVKFGMSAGFKIDGVGLSASEETTNTENYQYTTGSEEASSVTFNYTLEEEGDDDALTIDIFNAPDGFGPIFVTKGGRTSGPYEDREVTKYYQPGTEISAATKQIEVPQISVKNPILQNVPSGRKAVFTLELTNASETGEDCWFNLGVCDTTNPNGASFWISGTPLGNDRRVLVPADKTMTMTLEMSQANESVLDYRNIGIRLFSPTQKDNTGIHHEIADTCYVSATFVPAGPDVDLALSHNVLNINAGTDLTLSASGYDVNYAKLTGLQMEYRKDGENTWNMVRKFVKSSTEQQADPTNLDLLDDATESYTLDMKSMPDGVYYFRARTVSDFSGETVYGTSEEMKLVKDQSAPKLFGKANPSDGVLNADDEISVTFNEDIVTDELSQSNFVIQAAVNGQSVDHAVALQAQNTERAAYTEASYNLSKKDFSADMWVKYSGAGTLLSHGNGSEKFEVGTDNAGHLTLKIGENTYTSTKTISPGKWVFLTFNYKYDGDDSKFSALFAEDASDTYLFADETVAGYEGIGSLTLGKNLTGAIQELTLWDKARTCSEAKAEKDLTKKPSTPNLIGYWKMDEGEGTQIRDYARSRHMTMPQSTWYLNNVNYAVTLDGTKAMNVDISACSALSTDDYAVELWFKSEQSGKATLFSAIQGQGDRVEMGFNAAGALTLTSKDTENEISSKNLRDNAWHHLALNVLRNGSATVYVDGTAEKTMSADAVSALAGAKLVVGATYQGGDSYANYFNGKVDELRYWKATLSGDYIKHNRNVRLNGNEPGLVAYYPFEAQHFNDYQQSVIDATVADQSVVYNATSKKYELTGKTATMTANNVEFNHTDVPGLKPAPQLTNLNYTFVANERSIVINLTDLPEVLEGTTVNFTVRYATDKNYNMQSEINWTAFIKQNQLVWKDETEVSVEKQGAKSVSFEATITNESGSNENWSLSGLPSWLSANIESGTLKALQSKTIKFTVDESLPLGNYETTVYLTGSQNIAAPLTVSVTSEGDAPNWTVTPGENTMTIVGKLVVDGVLSNDPKDIVAAFRGTECVGVASPKYYSRYDSYLLMMPIYGTTTADLIYKAYDASTGTVYPSVSVSNQSAYTFGCDKTIGTLDEPATFTTLNEIEQDLSHDNASWKWFSLYAKPKTNDMSVVFKDAHSAITTVTDGTTTLMAWSGTLGVSYDKMYKLNATAPYLETLIGEPVNPADVDITLNSGWTWLGYPCQASNSLESAFADAEPQEGDLVKNQSSFAIYTENEWVGTLGAMQPGDGYMYQSNATTAKTFHFPKPTVSGRKNAPRRATANETNESHEANSPNWANRTYRDNMTMIAVVKDGDRLVDDAQVSVYSGTELRGLSTEAVRDGRHFLTIGGNSGEADALTFVVTTPAGDFVATASSASTFQADALRGSMDHPVVLMLGDATDIDASLVNSENGDVYDLSGRKVNKMPTKKGVYLNNGHKVVVK